MTKADEREMLKLQAMLGNEFPKIIQPKVIEETHAVKVREAEAVLKHLYHVHTLRQAACKNCGELFATNYEYQQHCSDECLRRTVVKLGLKWHPEKKPEDRWQGEPPSVIAPETLVILKKWAREIIKWDRGAAHIQKPTGKAAVVTRPEGMTPYEFLESLKHS
jgi:hypothetical protein